MSGVSVVIVNWNGLGYLKDCLASLGEAAEVVVVDNGSVDESVAYIQESWPRVKVVAMGRNAGFSAANNAGVAAADPALPYVLFLNNDTIVRPGAIAAMQAVLAGDGSIGAVSARLENAAGVPQARSVGALPTLASEVRRIFWSAAARARYERFDFDRSQEVEFACGAALMMPRRALEAIGGWPEEYFFYAEDAEVCRTLRRHGWRVWFESGARVVHFHGGSGSRQSTLKALRTQFIGHRSLNLYFRRHDGLASGIVHWMLYGGDLVVRPFRRWWGRRAWGRRQTADGRRRTKGDAGE